MPSTYTKTYGSTDRRRTAEANYRWLANVDSGVRLPALVRTGGRHHVFEHLGDEALAPEHLSLAAEVLGRLHYAAHHEALFRARLDRPFQAPSARIADFVTPRRHVTGLLDVLPRPATAPVAIYKDANIRNFVMVEGRPAIVDFDTLTLAPFGYDLAKLVVSAHMTHGHLDPEVMTAALGTYNRQTTTIPGAHCSMPQFHHWAAIHHHLTRRYLGTNGYRHPWTLVLGSPRGGVAASTDPGTTSTAANSVLEPDRLGLAECLDQGCLSLMVGNPLPSHSVHARFLLQQ